MTSKSGVCEMTYAEQTKYLKDQMERDLNTIARMVEWLPAYVQRIPEDENAEHYNLVDQIYDCIHGSAIALSRRINNIRYGGCSER